jgi:hypothetical protein
MAFVIYDNNGRRVKEVFDPKNITFRPPRLTKYKSNMVGLMYKDCPFQIQTPEMMCPYGTSMYKDEEKPEEPPKYSLDFSFRGMVETEKEPINPKIAEFHRQIEELEDVILNAAEKNSVQWFKKPLSRVQVETLFNPILRKSIDKKTRVPDGKYPDTIKFSLKVKDGQFETEAYDAAHNKYEEGLDTLIVKGTKATGLVRLSFLYFAAKFGLTTKLEQLKLKVPSRVKGYAFMDDDDEEGELADDEAGPASAHGSSSVPAPRAAYGFGNDEVDEEGGDAEGDVEAGDDDDLPPPAPVAPAPVATPAKVVRRRAGGK